MITQAEVETFLVRVRAAFDSESVPEKNVTLRKSYDMLRALADENERIVETLLLARANDRIAAAEARASAAENALEEISRAYDEWDADAAYASTALWKASQVAKNALTQKEGDA